MKKKVEIESFLNFVGMGNVEISPDGHLVAMLLTRANKDLRGYSQYLALYSPDHAGLTEYPEYTANDVFWRTSSDLIFVKENIVNSVELKSEIWLYKSQNAHAECICQIPFKAISILGMRDENTLIFKGTNNPGLSARLSLLNTEARAEEIRTIEDERNRFTVFDEYPYYFNGKGVVNGERSNVYWLNLETGEYGSYFAEGFHIEKAVYSRKDGKIVASGFEPSRVRMYKEALFVAEDDGSAWRVLVEKDRFRIEFLSIVDGRVVMTVNLVNAGNYKHTATHLVWVDIETGTVQDLISDPVIWGNLIVNDVQMGSGREIKSDGDWLYYIQGEMEDSYLMRMRVDGHRERLSGGAGSVKTFDVCGKSIYCIAVQDTGFPELYALEGGTLRQLTDLNSWFVHEYEVAPLEPLYFVCDQGIEIHGYVIKPVDYQPGRKYPMILDIHGGPGRTYGTGFMHEMQYWAAHGYFVAFCNPRGSAGRGAEFFNIFSEVGTKDYDDLMHFTDLVLKKYPAIDAGSLGVTGSSYGGYMTNWIVGHTNRFAAAASQCSISNFLTMEGCSDCAGYLCEEWTGLNPWTESEAIWRTMPLAFAKKAETPTLFLQADEDFRCPPTEALQMFTAMIQNGVEAKMLLFKGENHSLPRTGMPVNRICRLSEITAWIDNHIALAS